MLSALNAFAAGAAARPRGEGVRILLGVIGDRGDDESRGDKDQKDVDPQGDGKTAGTDALPELALHALRTERVGLDLFLANWRNVSRRGRGSFFGHREKGVGNLPPYPACFNPFCP